MTVKQIAFDNSKPHATFDVQSSDSVVLRAVDRGRAFWERTTPAQRAKAFLEWANRPRPPAPDLSDEALRRENMYD